MDWTDARVKKLRELVRKGLQASEIAKQLGGITRSSVIGKANRLGLSIANSQAERSEHGDA